MGPSVSLRIAWKEGRFWPVEVDEDRNASLAERIEAGRKRVLASMSDKELETKIEQLTKRAGQVRPIQ